jgi:sugar phosphate isomerase/epimerase
MLDFGVGSWSFGVHARDRLALPDALDLIRRWGYDAVDYGGFAPHPVPRADARELEELRAVFEHRSLKIAAFAPNFGELSLLDERDHARYVETFSTQADIGVALSAPLLRVETPDSPEDAAELGSEEAIARVVSVWSRCAEIAAAKGVKMVWEFEPCGALNTPDEVCALVDRLDSPGFGVLYDTAHAHVVSEVGARHVGGPQVLAGGQAELLERLRGRIAHVHVLDSDGAINETPGTTIHTPIGEGDVDFATIVPLLLAERDPVCWTIDLCFWPDPPAIAAQSLSQVRELVATYGAVESDQPTTVGSQ